MGFPSIGGSFAGFGFSGPELLTGFLERDWARSSAAQAAQQQERGAERAMAFSSAEAIAQRDFQERMSNSAWQRGVQDMMAAGINPMLAVSQGGASTPSGAMGQSSAAGGVQAHRTSFGSVGTSAQMMPQAQVDKVTAETDVEKAKLELTERQTRRVHFEIMELIEKAKLHTQSAVQMEQQTENLKLGLGKLLAEIIKIGEETKNETQRNALLKLETDLKDTENIIRAMELAKDFQEFKVHRDNLLGRLSAMIRSLSGARNVVPPVIINR